MPCIPPGAGQTLANFCRSLTTCWPHSANADEAHNPDPSAEVHGPRPLQLLAAPAAPERNPALLGLRAGTWQLAAANEKNPVTPRGAMLSPAEIALRHSTLDGWVNAVHSMGFDVTERLTDHLRGLPHAVPMHLACAALLLPLVHDRQRIKVLEVLYGAEDLVEQEDQGLVDSLPPRYLLAARVLDPQFPKEVMYRAMVAEDAPSEMACAMEFLPFIDRDKWEQFFNVLATIDLSPAATQPV